MNEEKYVRRNKYRVSGENMNNEYCKIQQILYCLYIRAGEL